MKLTQSNVKGNINYSGITIQGDYTNSSFYPHYLGQLDNVETQQAYLC